MKVELQPATGRGSEALGRGLACGLAALAGAVLVIATFHPGLMPEDAVIQLREARTGAYYGWHPPLMGCLWAVLDRLMPGPLPMLLVQNLMFWSGLAIAAYLARWPPLLSAIGVLAVGWFPPVFSALGTIWKDTTMAASLLLSYALFLAAQQRDSARPLLVGLVSLFYGFALRHNAALAVMPLAVWAGLIMGRLWFRGSSRPAALGLCLGVLIFSILGVLTYRVNSALVADRETYPVQQIITHDLTAISLKTDRNYLPDSMRTNSGSVTSDKLACIYTPESTQRMYGSGDITCDFEIIKATDGWRISDLAYAWIGAVTSNLIPYFEHRWSVFAREFGIDRERVCYPLQVGIAPNSLGIELHESALYPIALATLAHVAYDTPLYRGWVYLLACSALVAGALLRRRVGLVAGLVLASSALIYSLAYMFVGAECDFRYHWWLVVGTVVLPLVLFARPSPFVANKR